MKTITQIKDEEQKKLSKLFDSLGIFFAFSNEQFNAGKKQGVNYTTDGRGMIIPQENTKIFLQSFLAILKETNVEFNNNIKMDDYIYYELGNYECYYTGEYEEVFELVKKIYPQCTMKDVKRVYLTRGN